MKTTIQKTSAQISAEEIDHAIVKLSEGPPVFINRAILSLTSNEDPQAVLDVWGKRAALILNALSKYTEASHALALALNEPPSVLALPEGLLTVNSDGTVSFNPPPVEEIEDDGEDNNLEERA